MDEEGNWRTKTLLLGGIIGALTGLGAAFILIQRAERQGEPPKLGTGEGVKLGVWVLSLLRQIGDLGEG